MISRRDFLRVAGITAFSFAAAAQPITQNTKVTTTDDVFSFVVIADPQIFWGPLKQWERAIASVNLLKPAFAIVCGDMINSVADLEKRDRVEDERMAQAYLRVAGTLDKDIPLYHVAGNHDVYNHPTPETLAWYETKFGKPWYSFTYQNCLFIILESNVLKHPEGASAVDKWQIEWLRLTLENAEKRNFYHKTVYIHHPMFIESVDEKDSYGNMPSARRLELLELFRKYNITAVFSGHYHRNRYARYGDVELVTTSSSGIALPEDNPEDPLGFRIVKVCPGRIEHKYYSYEDMPKKL